MNSVNFKSPVAADLSSPQWGATPAPVPFAAFAPMRGTATHTVRKRRFFEIAGAAVIQAIFAVGLLYSTIHKPVPPAPAPLQVNILPDEEKVEPPPPPPMKPVMATPTIVMNLPPVPQIYTPPPLVTVAAPAAPNAPAATNTPVSGNAAAIAQNYQTELLRHLNRNKQYPATARTRHEQGMVYVHFTMNRQGRVLSVAIEKESRYADLNAEGLALLTRAQPLPAPPAEIAGDPIEMVVPVEFSLKGF